jgi:hypothetical protein
LSQRLRRSHFCRLPYLLSQAPAANKDMRATKDDFLYLDPAAFPADFAADVPPAEASFMAHSQPMLAKVVGPYFCALRRGNRKPVPRADVGSLIRRLCTDRPRYRETS